MASNFNKTVLISEPKALESPSPFLPYIWAILKSYWERHGDAEACRWLDPIFLNEDPGTLLHPYQEDSIDVLGLSCYTWNFHLQCALAERVKARCPSCLVVAGGPEPDYKDPAFFRKHPYIDVVAVKDGEITFTKILKKVLRGDNDFADVGGLYLPGTNGGGHVWTGRAEVPTEFSISPYVMQSDYYERLRQGYPDGFFHAVWETNRGCPYSCSFCDWGSSTMSKLRRFDMERVQVEAEWLARNHTALLFLADANFGILERDVEIAEAVAIVRQRYDFPRTMYYSAAKNNPDRCVEISKRLAASGLCSMHTLSVQHTRLEVLAATDRENISADKQVSVAKTVLAANIPIEVQLIVGIPGDTYELWQCCLADLMEWGIHEDYDVYLYNLLPNAPAAEPEFRRTWEVETIDRVVLADTDRPWMDGDLDLVRMTKNRIIVKSKTFSSQDWVWMLTYTAFIKALHNASVTRLIALYLRVTHGVPYLDFYRDIIEQYIAKEDPGREWWRKVRQCYEHMLARESAMDRMPVDEVSGVPYALDPSRWLLTHIMLQYDRLFDGLAAYLKRQYPDVSNLESVIAYQREIVIRPEYDRRIGKSFRVEFDWPQYFQQLRARTATDLLPEPNPMPGGIVEVRDQACGEVGYLVQPLDWEERRGDERVCAWIERTALRRHCAAKCNFQDIRLRSRDPASAAFHRTIA